MSKVAKMQRSVARKYWHSGFGFSKTKKGMRTVEA
jgi:hypothetical protein